MALRTGADLSGTLQSFIRRAALCALHVIAVLCLLMTGGGQNGAAQQLGTIVGTVANAETGSPLTGAQIRSASSALTATTDEAGRFRIGGVPPGRQTVEARLLGRVPVAVPVDVVAGGTVEVELLLSDSPVALDRIVVTATRAERQSLDVPAAIAVREVEELRRDGFMFGTDEFRAVPGISFRRGEGDGDEFSFVSFRGSFGTDGYLALIDGVPFVGVYEEALLYQVPYEAIERVEIVKGPLSALYGRGALYGAVNYVTRSPRTNAVRVSAAAGGDGYYRGSASIERVLGSRAGLLMAVSYEDYRGWRENGGRELINVLGKLSFNLGDRTTLTAYGNWADRYSELPNGIPLTADNEVIPVPGSPEAFVGFGEPVNDQRALIGAVRLTHQLAPNLTATVSAQGRRIDGDATWNFFDPFGFDASRNVYAVNGFHGLSRHDVVFGEGTLRWTVGSHDLLVGVTGERSTIDEAADWSGQFGFTPECGFAFFLVEIDYTTGLIPNRDHPCFVEDLPVTRDDVVNTLWGVFVQDEFALTDALRLTAGVRYDAYRRTVEFQAVEGSPGGVLEGDADSFSPKVSLSWRYDDGQVYASYGRGFNSNFGPTFEWDPASYARPENRPTTIDSYELGWKGHLAGGAVRFETALFYTRQRNRRITVPNPDAAADFTAPSNLITYGQIYESRGAEVSVQLLPVEGTLITASSSHIDPEWQEYVITTFGGDDIDLSGTTPTGIAPNTVSLSADQRVASWLSGRASFQWYDDYMVTQDNSVGGGGYELLMVGGSLRPIRTQDLFIDVTVTNVLHAEYFYYFGGRESPSYATAGPPRQLRTALRASF